MMTTARTHSGEESTGRTAGWVGSLAHTPLAEVLLRIVHEGRSGDLQVTLPDAIKTVYFDRGFVVLASSNLKDDRLGESMIEAGRISRQEFALASMVMKASNQKFGETLVQAGILSEEELGHYVASQVNRIVLSLFSSKTGMYSFDERPCTIPVELMVSLSVYRILLEGVRRMTRRKLVVGGLPEPQTRLRIASEPPFNLDVDQLRPVEKDVLRVARDGASISDIAVTLGKDEGVVLRATYGLYCAGLLEAVVVEPERRRLRVQEETGTFVLSEIRRKVQTKRVEPRREEPKRPVPAPAVFEEPLIEPAAEQAEFVEEHVEPVVESVVRRPVIEPILETAEDPIVELVIEPQLEPVKISPTPPRRVEEPPKRVAPRPSPQPPVDARKEPQAPTPSRPREFFWAKSPFLKKIAALIWPIWDWFERALLRFVGSDAAQVELETFTPAPPPPAPEPEPQPEPEMEGREALSPSFSSYPVGERHAPPRPRRDVPPEPVIAEEAEDRLQVPEWSILSTPEEPNELIEPSGTANEMIGVPSWSSKDSPLDGPKSKRRSSRDVPRAKDVEPRPTREVQATNDPVGVPSWSVLDASREPSFELESSPLAWSMEESPAAVSEDLAPLSTLDSELFIEGEVTGEDAPSMLSHIPIEEPVESLEVELQIDAEEEAAFSLAEDVETEAVPVFDEPVASELVFDEPARSELVFDEPVARELVFEEPVMNRTPKPAPSPGVRARPAAPVAPVARSVEDVPVRPRARRAPPPERTPPPERPASPPEDSDALAERLGLRKRRPSPSVSSAPDSRQVSEAELETGEEMHAPDDPAAKHAEAMLRARQGGGEARLLRDVKLHFKLQDWQGAIPLLEQLVHISPGSALYRGMLARAMSRDPMYRKDAEEHFIEALRLAPHDAELHYWLGQYYKSFGLKARAETEFRTVLRIDPKHQGARKQLGGGGERQGGDAIGTVFKKLFG